MVKPTELKVTVKNYLDGIDQKKLLGTKCLKCGFLEVPAKALCTKCLSDEIEIVEVKPEGKIAAFTCIGVGTNHFVNKGYSMKRPYCFIGICFSQIIKINTTHFFSERVSVYSPIQKV